MAAPTYDPAGNMTFHPQIGMLGYDAENRQTSFSFSVSGKTGTYVYDGDGRRIKRVSTGIGGETALFVYDAFDRLAAEYAPTAPSGAAQTEYRTVDHLGSTRVVTDGTQAVVARRDFYPLRRADREHLGRADADRGVCGGPGVPAAVYRQRTRR